MIAFLGNKNKAKKSRKNPIDSILGEVYVFISQTKIEF